MHPLITALVQGASLPDTITVMQTVPTGFQKLVAIAEIGAVFLAYVLVGAVIVAALKLKSAFEKTRETVDAARKEARELIADARSLAGAIRTVATAVTLEVDDARRTLDYANRRARRSIARVADRVDDMSNTLGLVQENTSNVVVSALAALKGVGAGVAALTRRPPKRPRPDDADDEATSEPVDAALATERPARPRLRRRAVARH